MRGGRELVNIKTASTLALGAVVISMAGLALWMSLRDSPASAQEIVQNACAKFGKVDAYDLTSRVVSYETIGVGPEELYNEWSGKGEFDGGNYRVESQEVTGEHREVGYIRVGDVGYREASLKRGTSGRNWTGKLGDWTALVQGMGSNPLCPTATDYRDLGSTTLNGEEVKRYTDAPVTGGQAYSLEELKEIPADGEGRRNTVEFWVNSNGELVQVYGTLWGGYIDDDGTPGPLANHAHDHFLQSRRAQRDHRADPRGVGTTAEA